MSKPTSPSLILYSSMEWDASTAAWLFLPCRLIALRV